MLDFKFFLIFYIIKIYLIKHYYIAFYQYRNLMIIQ